MRLVYVLHNAIMMSWWCNVMPLKLSLVSSAVNKGSMAFLSMPSTVQLKKKVILEISISGAKVVHHEFSV